MSSLLFPQPSRTSNAQKPDSALRIQAAVLGKPRPIGCGQGRLSGNLIDYTDFIHIDQQQDAGGKGVAGVGGGKGQSGTVTTTYQAAVIIGISEGPIDAVVSAWNQQTEQTLSSLNLTVFNGSYTQAPWGYMASRHPERALAYRGQSYVAAGPMQFGTSAVMPNLNYEVRFALHDAIAGQPDADPRDWITAFLTDPNWGIGFPSAFLDTMTDLSTFARAVGMVVTDILVSQVAANGHLIDLVTALNSEFTWRNGLLTVVPYWDIPVSGNGSTYTPDRTPVYDLEDSDIIMPSSGKDPVQWTRKRRADAQNQIWVEYLDRSFKYNPTPIDAKDDAAIQAYGLKASDTKPWHYFTTSIAAVLSAHLQLNRQAILNTCVLAVDARFIRADTMDLITLPPSVETAFKRVTVRIKEISEQSDGSLVWNCEQDIGNANSPNYPTEGSNPFVPDQNFCPGDADAMLIDAPLCLDPQGPSVYIVAAGPGCSHIGGCKGMITFAIDPTGYRTMLAQAQLPTVIFATGLNIDGDASLKVYAEPVAGPSPPTHWRIACRFENFRADNDYLVTTEISTIMTAYDGSVLAIPAGRAAVGIQWDFCNTGSGGAWTGKIVVDGVDRTSGHFTGGGATTFVRPDGTTGTGNSIGSPADEDYPLLERPNGSYQIAGGGAVRPHYPPDNAGYPSAPFLDFAGFRIWQLYVAVNQFLNLSSGPNFAKFFGAGFAPIDLGADGSLPTGVQPTLYFPGDTSTLGVSTAQLKGPIAGALGSGAVTDAPTITTGGYTAKGLEFADDAGLGALSPLRGDNNSWGGANVFISTDNVQYQGNGQIFRGTLGYLTKELPTHVDPDTTNQLDVDVRDSFGSLPAVTQDNADQGLSLCAIDGELLSYWHSALFSGSYNYRLTYLRRGLDGTAPATHASGAKFARIDGAAVRYPYKTSQIGSRIYVKLQSFNAVGGGLQTLDEVEPIPFDLNGPPGNSPPATLTISEIPATAGIVYAAWPPATGCGITGYDFHYDQGGADTVVLSNANAQQATVLSLAPGSYNFKVRAVNSAGVAGGWTTTTFVVA